MRSPKAAPSESSLAKRTAVMAGLLAAVCIAALISASPVGAADPPIGLGTANSYAVLAARR